MFSPMTASFTWGNIFSLSGIVQDIEKDIATPRIKGLFSYLKASTFPSFSKFSIQVLGKKMLSK